MKRTAMLRIGGAVLVAASALALKTDPARAQTRRLVPPKNGPINVAVVVGDGAAVIDFAGPWEVFHDARLTDTANSTTLYNLYMLSDATAPLTATGGMIIVPRYSFENAPVPQVIVVGAQRGRSDAKLAWLRKNATSADVTMSVCTGAFVLGAAGLLDGLNATTHHDYYDDFAATYPKVNLVRGPRYVENERISTAGGLASGFELALHVVRRYFGDGAVTATARYMEYSRSDQRPV